MEMGEGAGGRGYIKDNRSEYKEPGATRGAENRHGSEGSQQCQQDRLAIGPKKTATRVGQPREKTSARDIIRERVGGG